MQEFLLAMALIEEGKSEAAYEKLNEIIEKNPNHVDARYARVTLDISKLKTHTDVTLKDLHYLIDKKTKYTAIAYSFLTFIYDDQDDLDNVIKFGRLALKKKTPIETGIKFALARALARSLDKKDVEESLIYINDCLNDLEDSDQMSFQTCKCDILVSLERFNEARHEIDLLVGDFGHSALTYYLKARLNLKEYQTTKNKEFLKDTINNAKIALQYNEDEYSCKILLIEAYTLNGNYEEAITLIDTLQGELDSEDIAMEKIKVYDQAKEYDEGLKLIKEYLSLNESWKLTYMEGSFTLELSQSKENRIYARECFKKAYELYPAEGILTDIFNLNKAIDENIDSYNFLKEKVVEHESGMLYFYLAEVSHRLDIDFDETNEYYKKAYEHNYLNYNEYIDCICNYTKDPNQYNKEIKKLEKINLQSKYVWSKRKTAIRYIYQEDGYKQNLKKAKKIIEECLKLFEEDPCTYSLYGRCLELNKEYDLAYQYFQKAYELIETKDNIDCDCAYGYFANAQLNGIGTSINLDLAKEAIKKAVSISGMLTSSHIGYLYAYFYLSNDSEFDGNYAKKLLENNYPYYRYDISRLVLLSQVCKKLNQSSDRLNQLLQDLDKYPKEDIKYFNENIKKDISKPYWRNI